MVFIKSVQTDGFVLADTETNIEYITMYDTGNNEWDSIITYIDSYISTDYIIWCEGDNIMVFNATAKTNNDYQLKGNRAYRNMGVTTINWTTGTNITITAPSASIIAMNLSTSLIPERYNTRGYTNINAITWETAKALYYNGSTGQYQEIIDAINNTGNGIKNEIQDLNDNVMQDYDDSINDDEIDEIEEFMDTFNNKLGFIGQTFEFVSNIVGAITNTTATGTIEFPGIVLPIGENGSNETIIERQNVEIVPQGLSFFWDYIKLANNMILVSAVCTMALNKYKEITRV